MLYLQGNVDKVLFSIKVLSKLGGGFWKADNSSPVECTKGFVISRSHNKERKIQEQRSSNFVRFCTEDHFDENQPQGSKKEF